MCILVPHGEVARRHILARQRVPICLVDHLRAIEDLCRHRIFPVHVTTMCTREIAMCSLTHTTVAHTTLPVAVQVRTLWITVAITTTIVGFKW